jgi:hypothetical protein
MPDQELSETSDEEAPPLILTRAQKAAKTRARHVAEEQAASAQTEVEISLSDFVVPKAALTACQVAPVDVV